MECEFWIDGYPATYSTPREKTWKQQICKALSGKQYNGSSISLKFVFTKDNFYNHKYDIDNLCDPVFSALSSSLRWFSGKRSNITHWTASKIVGTEQGLLLRSIDADTLLAPSFTPLFDEVYDGKLPKSATDDNFPSWIKELGQVKDVKACSVRLIFENILVSIATISNVKAILDCLYPIIGGNAKDPNDKIIETLTVERVSNSTKKPAVRITIWEG